jgi:hypothetical protein
VRYLLILIASLLLFTVSCSETPAGLECITVFYPSAGDVWDYMQGNTHVEWAGAEGDMVRIDIYRGDEFFVPYLGWTENDGSAVRTDYLPPSCHGSGAYQIRIEDSNGNTGLGDHFTIMCGGLGDIQITYPEGNPVWTYNGSGAYVTWADSDGSMVYVIIYHADGTFIGTLIDWTENDGYAEPAYPLSSSLVPGDYYIQVIDDLGEFGIGGDFTIE